MKILFYRHTLLSRGGDKMIVEHANFLVRAGHDVVIQTAVLDSIFALDEKVVVQTMPSRSKFGTILRAVLKRFDADVVIADIIPLACFLWPRNGGAVLFYAQDYHESYYTNIFQKLVIKAFYRLGFSVFSIPTVVVAEHLKDAFLERYKFEAHVVENGVDLESFYPAPDPELLSAKGRHKSILVLSREDWRKGFDIACDVICQIATLTDVPIEVWTVGSSISGKFDGLQHRDFGYVDKEKMRMLMSSADLFLYPTRDEGFGLMPLEAMACGCPVVTSTAIDYVKDRWNGWAKPIDDVGAFVVAVVESLDDPGTAAEISQRGLELAKGKSLVTCCENFLKKIEELYA